jgi:hypothetical protein
MLTMNDSVIFFSVTSVDIMIELALTREINVLARVVMR